jgi:hypothetical protein
VSLWDFGWLDATRYVEPPDTARLPAEERLRRLVSSREYRNNFAESESWRKDPGPIHGPFRIEAILPACFKDISLPELQRRVQVRLTSPEFRPIADVHQRDQVDRLLHKVAAEARQCFYLNLDLQDRTRQHNHSFVHLLFDEYVVLAENALWLLVIGHD